MTDELSAYLSVCAAQIGIVSLRAAQIGMIACEIPVTRAYPKTGKPPAKISFFKGNYKLMKLLFKNARGNFYEYFLEIAAKS